MLLLPLLILSSNLEKFSKQVYNITNTVFLFTLLLLPSSIFILYIVLYFLFCVLVLFLLLFLQKQGWTEVWRLLTKSNIFMKLIDESQPFSFELSVLEILLVFFFCTVFFLIYSNSPYTPHTLSRPSHSSLRGSFLDELNHSHSQRWYRHRFLSLLQILVSTDYKLKIFS